MIFDIVIRLILSAASLAGVYLCLRWGLPQFRPLFPAQCEPVASSPFSRLFRIPFWWSGIFVYILTLAAAITSQEWIVFIAFVASVFALFASFYLTIIMVAKLRANCTLCWMANTLNVAIFVIWVLIARHA